MELVHKKTRLPEQDKPRISPLERLALEGYPLQLVAGEESVGSAWSPPVDFVEEKGRYVMIMDAPGMKKTDIHVDYKDGILYVRGQRAHEKEVGNGGSLRYTLERRCGSFMRHFHLNASVMPERIRADYKNGILKVTIPKNEKAQSKSVTVKVN